MKRICAKCKQIFEREDVEFYCKRCSTDIINDRKIRFDKLDRLKTKKNKMRT